MRWSITLEVTHLLQAFPNAIEPHNHYSTRSVIFKMPGAGPRISWTSRLHYHVDFSQWLDNRRIALSSYVFIIAATRWQVLRHEPV